MSQNPSTPSTDLTTLICLFHHPAHAQAALEDILQAGVPESNVTLVGLPGSQISASRSTLLELNVPEKDTQHLLDGIRAGGTVLTVSAISSRAEQVEAIFAAHSAGKIDEATVSDDMSAQALPASAISLNEPMPIPEQPESYNPLFPSELTDEGGETAFVTATIDDAGEPRITSVQPVETLSADVYASDRDVDPRELGLDARMRPMPTIE